MQQIIQLFVLLAVLLVIVTIVGKLLGGKSAGRKTLPPFRKRESVLTENERAFFHTLCRAIPDGHFIFANMRLIDLLQVDRKDPGVQTWKNKVGQKHVDFVICEPAQLAPLLVIEVDGRTHLSERQTQRDADKDACLRAAGIPLLRLPAKSSGYTLADLRERVGVILRPAN
jgi:hypothetical protein